MTLIARHFLRLSEFVADHARKNPRVRHAAAAVHIPATRCSFEDVVPLGLQYSAKAALAGALNMGTLQGGIEQGETPENALAREAGEEYDLTRRDVILSRYLLSTLLPVPAGRERARTHDAQWYHWHLLVTERTVRPNPLEVMAFGWYDGPQLIFDALAAARPLKFQSFMVALAAAVERYPELSGYRVIADICGTLPQEHIAA